MLRGLLLGLSFAVLKMIRDLLLGLSFAVLIASVLLCVLGPNLVKSNKKSTRRKADDTSASSSSPASAGSNSYDVFLSFSGEDTRKTFTDHLYKGLVDHGVRVFRDNNELPHGEKIGTNLFQAIENSKISIPILSRNYALSRWCLQELVKMTECIKSGHVVLPIFYHVEPTDVRNQKGSFREAFSCLSRKYSEDVEKWKVALQEVASLKGWESEKTADGYEGELVEEVVRKVLSELKKAFLLVVPKQLVGIDNAVKAILRLLDDNPSGTQITGIHGMGGIGKTTLAKVVYNNLLSQFQYHSFIEDIRESSRRYGIPYLQKQLISDMKEKDRVSNKDQGIRILESRFKRKKVLVLLDDVDDINQITALVGTVGWFAEGSKIIITTRSRDVLDKVGVNKYELKELGEDESLILFSRHAFMRESPPCDFESLSRAVVSITRGLPLALEVIGSHLYGKNEEIWRDELEKLREVPHQTVQEKLKISYDALENRTKEIFLDIACFFIGSNFKIVSYMWEAKKFFPTSGIETLSFLSLIRIEGGKLKMHDQLRDLGRNIVRDEDYSVPMNRSRLWDHENALEVLQRYKGIPKVRVQALCLDEDKLQRKFTTEQFEMLPSLRFLAVYGAKLIGDSESLLPDLRYLVWKGYPAFVATSFCLEKLVILDLSRSDISESWEGWSHLKVATKLKVLDLSYCCCLNVIPDLSAFQSLEILILEGCNNLEQIPHSIGKVKGLNILNLQGCKKLQELPQEIGNLKRLQELTLINCHNLEQIPHSIGKAKGLNILNLQGCEKLQELPQEIGNLERLQELTLIDCHNLEQIPHSIVKAKGLNILNLHGCKKLQELPQEMANLERLEELILINCHKLQSLPVLPAFLTVLKVSGQQRTFPQLSYLVNLKMLTVEDCPLLESMPELPSRLLELSVSNCGELKELPNLSRLTSLSELFLKSCGALIEIRGLEGLKSLGRLIAAECQKLSNLDGLEHLESLRELRLLSIGPILKDDQAPGFEKLKNLEGLEVMCCESLVTVDVSQLTRLEALDLCGCGNLLEIKGLERLKNLSNLELVGCPSIETLPDLSCLHNLYFVCVDERSKVADVPGVTKARQTNGPSYSISGEFRVMK